MQIKGLLQKAVITGESIARYAEKRLFILCPIGRILPTYGLVFRA
jgi:hypothetical protein